VAIGTAAFSMQDVLLEPYGGEVIGLSVSATTVLTAIWALGAIASFAVAARWLAQGMNPYRMAGHGLLVGIVAFTCVILADPMGAPALFFAGAGLIGSGSGLFAVATLTAAMTMPIGGTAGRGLALGAWGAAQATAAGVGIAIGGGLRDLVGEAALSGRLGEGLNAPATGYSAVYNLEILLLFATLVAIGPLVRTVSSQPDGTGRHAGIGLADFPT
jgi:BCD family chlorophyll transporter-like MFS transporter